MKRKIFIAIIAAISALCCAGMLSACGKTADPPENGMTKTAAYAVAAELGYDGTKEQFDDAVGAPEDENVLVSNVEVNEDNEIIVTYTDGTTVSLGKLACKHEYSDWKVEAVPTCTSTGYNTRTCSLCGDIDYQIFKATGHTAAEFGEINQSAHTFTCVNCGKEITELHSFDEHEVCTVCGYIADYTLGLKYEFDTQTRTYAVVKSCGRKVKNLVIPSTYKNYPVTKIAACAFLWEQFDSVTLPEGITSIGQSAFENTGLKSVDLPSSLTYIGDRAFAYCDFSEISLPDSLTKIGGSAFLYCKNLTDIKIPDGVKNIYSRTFYACRNLKEVTLSQNTAKIADYAFAHCASLSGVVLPVSLTETGDGAFAYCTNLKSIVLPEGITKISLRMFDGCKNLAELVVPESVTSIKWCALLNTSALKTITYNGTAEQWKSVKKTFGWKTLTNKVTGLKIKCSDGDLEYFD